MCRTAAFKVYLAKRTRLFLVVVTCKEDHGRQHSRCDGHRGSCVQVGLQLPVGRAHVFISILDLALCCSLNDGAGHLHRGKGGGLRVPECFGEVRSTWQTTEHVRGSVVMCWECGTELSVSKWRCGHDMCTGLHVGG